MMAGNLPSDNLLRALIEENGATLARRQLKALGYTVSSAYVALARRRMIKAGELESRLVKPEAVTNRIGPDDAYADARRGSEMLLRAQIAAGQVFPVAMARWQARHGVVA